MTQLISFNRHYSPLVTPLLDNDTMDVPALKIVEHVAGGVHGVFILGLRESTDLL